MTKANLTIRQDILGMAFPSAHYMRRYLPPAVIRLIVGQPGYTNKTKLCLLRTASGGIRLFAHTTGDSRTGEWMDASIQDLPITVLDRAAQS